MTKQKIRWFRLIFSGVVASALCVFLAHRTLIFLWKFDIFSFKQWHVITTYWNSNGVISQGIDYLFFLTLLLMCLIGICLWAILYRVNFQILWTAPLIYFLNRDFRKYENEDRYIKLKNMAPTEKKTLDEFINEKLKAAGIKTHPKGALVENIREKIRKKFLRRGS